nr:MAG TPA: hypothetical protein [Caudoviricetes sp.]
MISLDAFPNLFLSVIIRFSSTLMCSSNLNKSFLGNKKS